MIVYNTTIDLMKTVQFNIEKESLKISSFLRTTFHKQRVSNAVIGISGGVDSMTSYYLLKKALPEKNIFPVHLPYGKPAPFVPKNIPVIPIKKPVDAIKKALRVNNHVRLGNIMARVRMIILYDLAKKHNALVCGTENKSEQLLGYFTRFGDSASDIEPIQHLYKTQVKQLAKYLGVPKQIIDQYPTAGLWEGQTDEGEFGFTYEEADQVLYLYFEKKYSLQKLEAHYKNTKKIIQFAKHNNFKHLTPYILSK